MRLGERLVFRDSHWALREGEHWVVVGPNGSGKTVFCRALCGDYPVTGGGIAYGFRPRAGREPESCVERVALDASDVDALHTAPARWFSLDVEQSPPVAALLERDAVEGLNPYEIVERAPADTRRWEAHARRVIRWVGIGPLLGRPLLALSNGERRKVLLARALLRRPRVLILDDPFAGLDAPYRQHLRALIETLIRHGGLGIILVSLRPDEWPRGMTHLMHVERFRVAAQGPIAVLRRDPGVIRLLDVAVPRGVPARRKGPAGGPGRDLIRLRSVQVRWGDKVILDNVDWTVRAGESWAIVGPNGSGKSTLLSLVLGENPQVYANDVRVFGRCRGAGESVWAIKRHIGWVSPELHGSFGPAMTGLEAVLTGFYDATVLAGMPSARRRAAARAVLRRLGVATLAAREFGLMSAGEQRLVLLARALVKAPRLLVLDEPCQGLDRHHGRVFVATVDRLIRHGVTALYVTHQPDEIPPAIGCLLRVRQGRARVERTRQPAACAAAKAS